MEPEISQLVVVYLVKEFPLFTDRECSLQCSKRPILDHIKSDTVYVFLNYSH
jgi:hypothetical protein